MPLMERASNGGDAQFKSRGTSYVSMAIRHGRLDLVNHLVYHLDALLDEDGKKLRQAIFYTTALLQIEIWKLLLEYGKQKKLLCDFFGHNTISSLIWNGRADFVRKVLPIQEAEGWISGVALCKHAQSEDIHNARKIIKEGRAYLNVVDKDGFAPLHYAAQLGQEKLVEELAHDPQVILDSAALQFALWSGHQRIVEILLENALPLEAINLNHRSADMPTGSQYTEQLLSDYVAANTSWNVYPVDSTPLLRFCATGSLSMVKSSYRRAPHHLNEPNSGGVTPFLQAVKSGRHEIAQYLLREGCKVEALECTEAASYSALMFAVKNGDAEMVRILLEEALVDPAYENEAGETALALLDPQCASADQIREDIQDALDMSSVFPNIDV